MDEKAIKLENLKVISGLHKVEGFNVEAEAVKIERELEGAGFEQTSYLPLPKKKAWFRLALPKGKITCEEIYPALPKDLPWQERKKALTEVDKVIVVARVYENVSDPVNCYIGEGIGVAYQANHDMIRPDMLYPNLLLLARGQAESRALYNAGFGLQFYGKDEVDLIDALADDVGMVLSVNGKDISSDVQTNDGNHSPAIQNDVVASFSDISKLKESEEEPEKEKGQKRIRRTYPQKASDAYDALEKLRPMVEKAAAQQKSSDKRLVDVARARMRHLESEWYRQVDELDNALSHATATNPIEQRTDVETSFDAVVNAASSPTDEFDQLCEQIRNTVESPNSTDKAVLEFDGVNALEKELEMTFGANTGL